ncbi:hypothetical protein [Labilibacter marinus]|uniref:hypothetical protein n=1 Tax=Labilibacter marinus TaxID=1477105 RepID=UPI00082CBFB1|nr:hypothetical protein [Labilibacter marinus]
MNLHLKKAIIFTFAICGSLLSSAQTLQRPVIWATSEEKVQILNNIEKYDWAKSIVDQLHKHVDGPLAKHQLDPSVVLNMIPEFAKHDRENKERKASPLAAKHNKVLALASDAGVLYYLTEDEKYASFAADILVAYIDEIAPRTPETTTICGYEFFDPRTTYGPFAITYDFIHNYLTKPGVTVYEKATGKQVAFDNAKAQKAIANMVGNVLQEYGRPDKHGRKISNHPILTASGALFGILCIDDDVERERLFNVFWETGTWHQNSFKHTILPMFSGQGIWPESLSYSFMPIVTMVLNIVDRVYPNMNVTVDYQHVFEGNFLFDYLRNPNRTFVRYGDSKRNNDSTGDLYRYTLSIADRKGYPELKKKAELALRSSYDAKGGYNPTINPNHIFNNFQALELLWGLPIPNTITGDINFNRPTVIVEHAGVALQRNTVVNENENFGLCGIIGGAHYVHSHLTGIAMELYGAGYVMAPNAGLPATVRERKIPLHEHYFRLYAGNNTVIVNGASHGLDEGSWKGKAHVWQNKCVNIAAEPAHLQESISNEFSFAMQHLDDKVNNCNQQRTLSTIRTSDSTAYYFDMFRSKSNDINKFHDYIYHNIGDKTQLTNKNGKAQDFKQTDRYQNDIGDVVHSPGWRYFKNTVVTSPIKDAVKIRFDIEYDNRYMHMFVPNGVEREYTTALAPPTREARNGYLKRETQVLAIRQQGEAWNRPFVAVFEPSVGSSSSVQSIEPLKDGDKIVGAKVVSKVGIAVITDYIISQDNTDEIYINKKLKLKFKGRFAIVRTKDNNEKTTISLYIGEGKELNYKGNKVIASSQSKAYKTIEL